MRTTRIARAALLALVAAMSIPTTGSQAAAAAPEGMLYDDALVAVHESVPEFAGVWVDEQTGSLVVALTRPGQAIADAVRGSLAQRLGRPDLGSMPVDVRAARFSFAELKGWHDAITAEVLALPGTVLTDVDERGNVVRVGVENVAAQRAAVEAVATARNVPTHALVVEHADPVVADSSLRDAHLPAVGGLEIGFARPAEAGLFICTMGFPAIRGGVRGFVTNSHCTATRGVVENTLHTQPSIGHPIGVEIADPAHFTGGACPSGRTCRRSDAAFSTLAPAAQPVISLPEEVAQLIGAPPHIYNQGRIARPALGSFAWDGTSTFRITGEGAPVLGETLTRVGRTTGRGAGSVGATCTNYNVSGSNITMICQGQAAYGSAGGDSGSPVFRASGTDATLRGIHWGSGGVFSPIGNIQLGSELGAVGTCAPGFSC